jgi:hypothetical protein
MQGFSREIQRLIQLEVTVKNAARSIEEKSALTRLWKKKKHLVAANLLLARSLQKNPSLLSEFQIVLSAHLHLDH